MKLNNKGFAISTIMYMILILSVTLIILVLALLSARKLTLDGIRNQTDDSIYNLYGYVDQEVLDTLKSEAIDYATNNNVTNESIKISDFNTSINPAVLYGYNLNDKYLTIKKNGSTYDVWLGKESKITDIDKSTNSFVDILNYKIYGNSKQNTYTGKNLFSGLIRGKGLSTSSTNFGQVYDSSVGAVSDFIPVDFNLNNYFLSGLTNKIYSCVLGYDENKQAVIRTSESARTDILLNSSAFSESTRVSNNPIKYIRVTQYETQSESGTIDSIDELKIQLEEGEAATEYEPYVGGMPSPSPDYPQEIRSVGVNNLITGFTEDYETTYVGATWAVKSGEKAIIINGRPEEDSGKTLFKNKQSILLKAGKTYKFRAYSVSGTTVSSQTKAYLTDSTNDSTYYEAIVNGGAITITPSSNMTVYTGIASTEWKRYNNYTIAFELFEVEGSTKTSKYDIPIIMSGKNLFNYKSLVGKTVTENGGTLTINSNGGITASGTPTGSVKVEKRLYNLPPSTYTFSLTGSYANIMATVYLYDTSGNIVHYFDVSSTKVTIDLKDYDYSYVSVVIKRAENNVAMSGTVYFQIEKGTQATEYETYVEDTTRFIYLNESLRGIGNSTDYIDFGNSKVVKNVKEINFDGSEGWTSYTSGYSYVYSVAINDKKIGFQTSLSNKFINKNSAWESSIGGYGLYSDHDTTQRVYFDTPNQSSAGQFRNWLDSHVTTVDYALTTPIETTITLPSIKFDGEYTNISIGTNTQPSKVEFTVIEKIQKL